MYLIRRAFYADGVFQVAWTAPAFYAGALVLVFVTVWVVPWVWFAHGYRDVV